jgi:hypothetical protein
LFYGLCGVVIIFGALWLHEKYWGNSKLASENARLTLQLTLAETQLAPFKAIALEKYPGRWEEALTKLASNIQRFEEQLKNAQNRIRSMDIEVAIELSAKWKENVFPEPANWIWINEGSGEKQVTAEIEFVHNDGRTVSVLFRGFENFDIQKGAGGTARLTFRSSAENRSPIFDFRTDEFHNCMKATWTLVNLKPELLAEEPLTVLKSEIDIVVNNRSEWNVLWDKEYVFRPPFTEVLVMGMSDTKPWKLRDGPSARPRQESKSPFVKRGATPP